MNRIAAGLIISVLLVSVGPRTAQCQAPTPDSGEAVVENSRKADSIRALIDLTQAGQLANQVLDRMIRLKRQQHPEVPQKFWTAIRREADMRELTDRIVPVYARHFTQKEVNKLLDFYRSPVGRKVVKKMPSVMQECMTLGRQWGRELRQQLMQRLRDEGYVET